MGFCVKPQARRIQFQGKVPFVWYGMDIIRIYTPLDVCRYTSPAGDTSVMMSISVARKPMWSVTNRDTLELPPTPEHLWTCPCEWTCLSTLIIVEESNLCFLYYKHLYEWCTLYIKYENKAFFCLSSWTCWSSHNIVSLRKKKNNNTKQVKFSDYTGNNYIGHHFLKNVLKCLSFQDILHEMMPYTVADHMSGHIIFPYVAYRGEIFRKLNFFNFPVSHLQIFHKILSVLTLFAAIILTLYTKCQSDPYLNTLQHRYFRLWLQSYGTPYQNLCLNLLNPYSNLPSK